VVSVPEDRTKTNNRKGAKIAKDYFFFRMNTRRVENFVEPTPAAWLIAVYSLLREGQAPGSTRKVFLAFFAS